MRPLDELLDDAKWGKLTKNEIEYVANRLKEARRHKEEPDAYTLLHILGKSGAIEHRSLIESFMLDQTDPEISSIAFKALVHYLNLITEYTNEIKLFLKGVPWDKYDDLRISAIFATGRYLTGYDDSDMLKELIQIAENPNEDQIIRKSAYQAMYEASGHLPRPTSGTTTDEFAQAYNEAKQRLARLEKNKRGN